MANPEGMDELGDLSDPGDANDENEDEFDDDGDDIGQTLEYTFTRVIEGDDFAEQMDVFAPGTVIFVNSVGEEIQRHEGSFGPAGDEDTLALIQEYWNQIVE